MHYADIGFESHFTDMHCLIVQLHTNCAIAGETKRMLLLRCFHSQSLEEKPSLPWQDHHHHHHHLGHHQITCMKNMRR